MSSSSSLCENCNKYQKRQDREGTVHNFCGRTCAEEYAQKQKGTNGWNTLVNSTTNFIQTQIYNPVMGISNMCECCNIKPKYYNLKTGKKYDHCSKDCANSMNNVTKQALNSKQGYSYNGGYIQNNVGSGGLSNQKMASSTTWKPPTPQKPLPIQVVFPRDIIIFHGLPNKMYIQMREEYGFVTVLTDGTNQDLQSQIQLHFPRLLLIVSDINISQIANSATTFTVSHSQQLSSKLSMLFSKEVKKIHFYEKNEPFYWMTNFAEFPFECDQTKMKWPTSEHYFQGCKFINHPHLMKKVALFSSSRDAFEFARNSNYQHMQVDANQWRNGGNIEVMRRAIYLKFSQNSIIANKLLLNSPDCELVERTDKDSFWGDGGNGSGNNNLGKLLMELRENMRKASQHHSAPSRQQGFPQHK